MDCDPIALFTSGWSQPPLDKAHAKMTQQMLADVPGDELCAALVFLARTHGEWRPNAATIRRTVVELRGLFPSLAEAGVSGAKYAEIRAFYAQGGSCHLFPDVHPCVADAVKAAGVDQMGSFAKAYREIVDDAFTAIQAADLRTPVEFRPVRVARNHQPSELVWRAHGWWRPDGVLERADVGDRFPSRLGVEDVPAIGAA